MKIEIYNEYSIRREDGWQTTVRVEEKKRKKKKKKNYYYYCCCCCYARHILPSMATFQASLPTAVGPKNKSVGSYLVFMLRRRA